MENAGNPGLRLLSLDGGGIRGLSMLVILEHLMWKLKVAEDLPEAPRPCEYFDLIGGTSTGGLIALMLGRLRMSVKEAVNAYAELSKEVFSDMKAQGSDGRFKASKLEKAIKRIVGAHSTSRDPDENMKDINNNACKTFVCAMNAANMTLPILFRSYDTPDHPATDCKIWQAARATSAAPTFFKKIKIGPPGIEETFVDGGMGKNNPVAALLSEAKIVFPDRQIACIISLGTGQPHTIQIPTKPSLLKRLFPLDVVTAIKSIATDCEKEHQFFAQLFDPVPHVYFRFNVEQGLQDIRLNQWERLGDVAANTKQYILAHPARSQLADAVNSLLERTGKISSTSLNSTPAAVKSRDSEATLTLIRCPPPSQIFQGRRDILGKMDGYFSKNVGDRHVYVLYGLGGSGKTQIALKYLDMTNRHQTPRFTKQFFVDASSVQTLETGFINIAISQKIGKTSNDASQWLISQVEEWMLLFDNADNPNIDLFKFFPRCAHGNIIITSRNPQTAVHGPMSNSRVGDMNEKDAIDLLLLSAVKEKTAQTTDKASEIVKVFFPRSPLRVCIELRQELSCLPLAVIQAGAYISNFNCLHQYLSIYRQNRAKLLSQHSAQSHDNYSWTVYTTWQISFERLSATATRLLQLCSLVHHDRIPEAIFREAAAWTSNDEKETHILPEAKQFLQNFLSVSGSWDAQHFLEIIAEIEGYSLIDTHTMGDIALSIHPLVHSWCRNTLGDEPIAQECMMDIIGMSIRSTDDEAYLFRIGLISHIDSLIHDPAVIKPLFQDKYACVYFDSGRFKEVASLQGIVLQKQQQLLGADHPDTLRAMARLGATYHKLGSYKNAETLKSLVLDRRKQLFGADHPDTLWAMATLAATYCELGRYSEAEPLEGIVLEKRKKVLGENHPDTLSAMSNLAGTYHDLGRYVESERLRSIVLQKRRQQLGADHVTTLIAMGQLGATYRKLGRYQKAEALEDIVLEKLKRLLGTDHPTALWAMANLAATYHQLGKYQEAEILEHNVLEKRKKLLGADHPDTLRAAANLAATYCKLGRNEEAEPLKSLVLQRRNQLLGTGHLDTFEAVGLLQRGEELRQDHIVGGTIH